MGGNEGGGKLCMRGGAKTEARDGRRSILREIKIAKKRKDKKGKKSGQNEKKG